MDTFPDLGSLTDQELKDLIKEMTDEEIEVSYRRRILHGKIDILRAELVSRLRRKDESGELADQRRRRADAHRHPHRELPAGRTSSRRALAATRRQTPTTAPWRSTALSAASPTLTARTTASAAARSSAAAENPVGDSTATYRISETGEFEEVPIE